MLLVWKAFIFVEIYYNPDEKYSKLYKCRNRVTLLKNGAYVAVRGGLEESRAVPKRWNHHQMEMNGIVIEGNGIGVPARNGMGSLPFI